MLSRTEKRRKQKENKKPRTGDFKRFDECVLRFSDYGRALKARRKSEKTLGVGCGEETSFSPWAPVVSRQNAVAAAAVNAALNDAG